MFGRQWADLLGLDWEAGEPLKISTAAGSFYAHLHEVTIQLLEFKCVPFTEQLLYGPFSKQTGGAR